MPSKNRKKEHFGSCLTINSEKLVVNSSNIHGVYPIIIERLVEQLDAAIRIHKRVLVLRFDLHLREYSGDNKIISTFMNRLKQWIGRKFKTKNIGYCWVREMEKAKHQHYHVALFIDGDVVRTSHKLLQAIRAKWFQFGHSPIIKNPYYFIDKHNLKEKRASVIKRLSYYAKIRGKGRRDPQAKDYGASRLKAI